jgi:hypothetical protein
MDCNELLTQDILRDCKNIAIGGNESDVVIIAKEDVDYAATTFDAANNLLVTDLVLKSGKTGYKLEGVKQTNQTAYELVKKENSVDKYKHTFTGVILSPTAANKAAVRDLASGGDYIVVVNRKFKGEGSSEAFEIYGFRGIFEIATLTYNSNENDGVINFSLSHVDGYEDPEIALSLLETDYDTTLTAFNNSFATAAV